MDYHSSIGQTCLRNLIFNRKISFLPFSDHRQGTVWILTQMVSTSWSTLRDMITKIEVEDQIEPFTKKKYPSKSFGKWEKKSFFIFIHSCISVKVILAPIWKIYKFYICYKNGQKYLWFNERGNINSHLSLLIGSVKQGCQYVRNSSSTLTRAYFSSN